MNSINRFGNIMPERAKRVSLHNGRPSKRLSAAKRGYDYQWRLVRAQKLKMDPVCED